MKQTLSIQWSQLCAGFFKRNSIFFNYTRLGQWVRVFLNYTEVFRKIKFFPVPQIRHLFEPSSHLFLLENKNSTPLAYMHCLSWRALTSWPTSSHFLLKLSMNIDCSSISKVADEVYIAWIPKNRSHDFFNCLRKECCKLKSREFKTTRNNLMSYPRTLYDSSLLLTVTLHSLEEVVGCFVFSGLRDSINPCKFF